MANVHRSVFYAYYDIFLFMALYTLIFFTFFSRTFSYQVFMRLILLYQQTILSFSALTPLIGLCSL